MSGNRWDGANCLDVSPDVMQPEKATKAEVAAAKQVCRGCPLVAQCLDLARSQRSLEGNLTAYGVHAGLWFGPDPSWVTVQQCGLDGCDAEVRAATAGAARARFCSPKHRVAAYRARSVGA